jgi:xanthine/uracil/vitamin C permease (AzgA family)
MQKLRDEIVEAQKARLDLVKWKLIIVSALGATAIGLSPLTEKTWNSSLLGLLALVPLVSLYVDSLCYHIALRTVVIGAFLGSCRIHTLDVFAKSDELRVFHAYEKFAAMARSRHGAFSLEDWALAWSTGVLSIGNAMLGVLLMMRRGDATAVPDLPIHLPLIVSGLVGMAGAYLLLRQFRERARAVERCELPPCEP